MDLNTIESIRMPRTRSELGVVDGEAFLGGGSWLFSEPQTALHTLIDLTALGWTPLERSDTGLRIAATCTLAELSRMPNEPGWAAHQLFRQCCTALLGSFKVWNVATVGGNIALALPAGPMTALACALDATMLVWTPTGDVRYPATDFVTGVQSTVLRPGEVLRAIDIPLHALTARTAYRQISLRPVGRSGALVIGRSDADGTFTLVVTAATPRPYTVIFDRMPSAELLHSTLSGIDDWYDDPHGAPDWRRAMTLDLADEIRAELA